MREILFKAKRLDNDEWVEGWIVPTMSNTYPDGCRIIDVHGINYDELDYWEPNFISWKVDKNTICQYTGLSDKNGKKIWENDIIRCGRNTVVSWDDHFASWCLTRKGWLFKHFFGESQNPEDCEVIGNIFDNLELLEGGGEDE